MNLLFICDEYPPGPHGGIGAVVQTLAREMVRQGHRVWIAGLYDYGYGGKDYEVDEGVAVYRLRKKSEWMGISMRYTFYDKVLRKLLALTGRLEKETAEGMKRLQQLVQELTAQHQLQIAEVPDHQHYTRQVRQAVFFPDLGLPTVIRLHGGFVYFATEAGLPVLAAALQMEQKLLSEATAISSVSRYTADKTIAALGLHRDVFVLPNGVGAGALPDLDKKDPWRVVFTGSLLAKKGVFELMEAWNTVIAHSPQARLAVYGKGDTDTLKAILSPEARNTVVFHGHQPHRKVLEALQQASVAVLPSFAEAFALAPLEAMACGVATVYSTRTSGPELIEDGVDGLLVDPSDVAAIAQATLSLLHQATYRKAIAKRGYEKIQKHYTIKQVAAAHQHFYESLLQSTPSAS